TMLGLCGVEIPDSVEGLDYSEYLSGGNNPGDDVALLSCVSPFGQFTRNQGGREFRGLRTKQYTYVRSLDGPWLLYNNETDPYQLENLCDKPEHAVLQSEMDALLDKKLEEANDEFLPGEEYIRLWGYKVDETGTVGYSN
ncbi:MAG: sulfatase, partial [Planctomycetota bacterium]|nr:sulfatase [Planctomycetota bacterium]